MDLTGDRNKEFSRYDRNSKFDFSDQSSAIAETSGVPDLLRNVKALREKFSNLETARTNTGEKLDRLARATDVYTGLLARPTQNDSTLNYSYPDAALNISMKSDLLDDDAVRYAFDRLSRRVAQLENHTDLNGVVGRTHPDLSVGRPSDQSVLSTSHQHTSTMEKARSAAIPTSIPSQDNPFSDDPHLSFSKAAQVRQSRPSKRSDDIRRHLSFDSAGLIHVDTNGTVESSSSGRSSLRPLSRVQMSKLRNLQEELRHELVPNQEKFNSSATKRLTAVEASMGQREKLCGECGQRTSSGCMCGLMEIRKNPVPPLKLPMDNTDYIRRRLITDEKSPFNKLGRGTQTSFGLWTQDDSPAMAEKGIQVKIQGQTRKRASSVPSSFRRSLNGNGALITKRPPPFVSCKSAGKSHSVLVNMQQLFAILKVQNPFLYQACHRRNESDLSLTSLVDIFQRELKQLIHKRQMKLKRVLVDYDALSAWVNSESITNEERIRTKKRLKKLANILEMTDTEVQRLKRQLEALIAVHKEAKLSEQNRRPCHVLHIFSKAGIIDMEESKTMVGNYAKPTTSTILRSGLAKTRSKSAPRVSVSGVRALREMRMVTSAMRIC